MRGDGKNMGTDDEKIKHNPNSENLKSLLKKPGKKRQKKVIVLYLMKTKNEFFDADYIILIREECEYDDEDDDSVCTCNQHEMVRLTCCEPNCNCSVYEEFEQTPQSPKFAPPIEFVDAVTLSPPEGYKDMELGEQLLALQQITRRGQRTVVCRECSASHDDTEEEDAIKQSYGEAVSEGEVEAKEEKERTDQSQQTTPTTPPLDEDTQHYILETITMTSIKEQNILHDICDDNINSSPNLPSDGSPVSGILKGGLLWKHQEVNSTNDDENVQLTETAVTSDDESCNRRSVRFVEYEEKQKDIEEETDLNLKDREKQIKDTEEKPDKIYNNVTVPEATEMMLTFKLGNHVLISNNSLKPNSAVRQLFPCTKPLTTKVPQDESIDQYLITAESLRAFEEAKRSKLPQIIQSGDTNESIKRAIERNTLRRSLILERIKQLTCDIDDVDSDDISTRISPTGEETRDSLEINYAFNKFHDKSFSPSSSSTSSSNSSSVSSTYKKITDIFGKREKTDMQNITSEPKAVQTLPDIGGPQNQDVSDTSNIKVSTINDSRKQFLSTLAPLTACVSNMGNPDEYYYNISNEVGKQTSVASSVYTEYTLEDIDEGLIIRNEDTKCIAPDVLAGTPLTSEYQPEQVYNKEEDDEHDDYGFNRRPSVQGIKPRFGSTTEILQQIQTHLQMPVPNTKASWPYYSESGLTGVDNSNKKNMNQNISNFQYSKVPDEVKSREFSPQYLPTLVQDDNSYQNCANQRLFREVHKSNLNSYSSVVGGDVACNEYYHYSLPRPRYNNRPLSPPPQDISKTYHQTMVYIPYNHIEGYQSVVSPNSYYQTNEVIRVSNQNKINKRYVEPIYSQRIHHVEGHSCNPNIVPTYSQKIGKPSFLNTQPPLSTSGRCESPLLGQFSTARSTQTSATSLSTCNNYHGNFKYRIVAPGWKGGENYITNKANRHSFPLMRPGYPVNKIENISVEESDKYYNGQIMPNGFRHSSDINNYLTQKDSTPNSPTAPRFIERGVPEGAASVSSLDSISISQNTGSTVTSPTTPQNYTSNPNPKPLFYAMNV
ncbi:hypothetical protein NQ314_005030 [Rhamnusium bicolor]|uniref:Uncharacterized protein n=1 Tax=Rhamnusium bicolor TaxID=1586634 RepID=A0AAV8ZKA2_9CUCU|nr:hypothetical protein NQ314_005030 [Rhamnusium bicolor]